MEKNNVKYFTFSILLIGISIYFIYNTFCISFLYNTFDFTGLAQILQRFLAITTLIISVISLVKALKAREEGVDYLFNKCMVLFFSIYAILSISTYIFIRNSEESKALQMRNDIAEYSSNIIQNEADSNSNYYILADVMAESEYFSSDEYYDRKNEIAMQIENSSVLERYLSMLFINPSYKYYNSLMMREIEYYQIFLKYFLIGFIGVIFYLFNIKLNDNTKIFYENQKK